jgi:hypothetical protein
MVVAQADCPARRVPDGTPLTIPKDTFVTITQALGGNYTVTYNGQMVRVDGTDAANLGLEPELLSFPQATDDRICEEQVWEALRTVYDPDLRSGHRSGTASGGYSHDPDCSRLWHGSSLGRRRGIPCTQGTQCRDCESRSGIRSTMVP